MVFRRYIAGFALGAALLAGGAAHSQGAPSGAKARTPESVETLKQEFFAAIEQGNTGKVLSYVPKQGMNVGPQAEHPTRDEVERQFASHRGVYCRLFDSSCISGPIQLDDSSRPCSYHDLLTKSEKVRTAGSEVTRNGVQQAVLVAEIKNDQCPNDKLIDFIFNLDSDGWKLFSVP